ncbi:MAG: hypothetical protein HN494_00790 [Opitutae bacterium]|nr:hypothetical protein [Opitutae bacterium]MBT5908577.1 hypothetical protein [Opitutae bacterium]MBT6850807.1 hypothetical protein [Opitutae bacterium]MBT7740605.1 hypothetical protein [Opitutae bacterium]MBT7922859.1 hypothetical protein [Opitutae bacterium]
MKKLLVAMFVALLMAGCATSIDWTENYKSLRPMMTEGQVIALLGKPKGIALLEKGPLSPVPVVSIGYGPSTKHLSLLFVKDRLRRASHQTTIILSRDPPKAHFGNPVILFDYGLGEEPDVNFREKVPW